MKSVNKTKITQHNLLPVKRVSKNIKRQLKDTKRYHDAMSYFINF